VAYDGSTQHLDHKVVLTDDIDGWMTEIGVCNGEDKLVNKTRISVEYVSAVYLLAGYNGRENW
jgi:hypothetical protein